MAVIQGGYVRRLPQNKIRTTAIKGLWIIIPSFICVGMANSIFMLYVGLFLFAVCKLRHLKKYYTQTKFLATAMVVPCMMTLASEYGLPQQKGSVMGIFRSLGALARAVGPIFASVAFWSLGSTVTYLFGAAALLWPVLMLRR